MGAFLSLFKSKEGGRGGKSKDQESRVTEQDRAVLQLKQQRDKLKQYQKKVTAQLERERQVARQLLREGRQDKAMLLLRKKKFQEGLLSKTDAQLDNIEQMVSDIEFAQIESKVIEGLKVGNESLKKMQAMMSLEDVESIMDETSEAVEYQRQISALLAGDALSEEDEEEVLAELERLTAGDLESALPDVPSGGDNELSAPSTEDNEPTKTAQKTAQKQAEKQAVLA